MQPLKRLIAPTLVLPQSDIDTDQIIPARFLTTTERTGLGAHAFADWRFDADGVPVADSPLNQPSARQSSILVAGDNFGCGSSREHAPWALLDFGFRVVIASSIADIFKQNAQTCGLLPLELPGFEHQWLLEHPGEQVIVDVEQGYVELAGGHRHRIELDPFVRHCFLEGLDPLGYLLQHRADIERFEKERG